MTEMCRTHGKTDQDRISKRILNGQIDSNRNREDSKTGLLIQLLVIINWMVEGREVKAQ